MRNILSVPIGLALITYVPRAARDIDRDHSVITIQVDKAGWLSSFGDRHIIQAPIARGTIEDSDHPAIEFEVESSRLKVLDRDLSPARRLEVKDRMLGPAVLDAERYPTIAFHSTAIEVAGPFRWHVNGELTLHGVTHAVSGSVSASSDHSAGSAMVSQRDFGIEPIAVAGGLVKVKNDVRVDFTIVSR
jgi:polyisoprenoid-binding protein YceI